MRRLILPIWCLLAAGPYLYNRIDLWLTGDAESAGFLTGWVIRILPGIASASQANFPYSDPERLAYPHYAAVDLLWAVAFGIANIMLWTPFALRIQPATLALRTRFSSSRIIGVLGSVGMVLLLLVAGAALMVALFGGPDLFAAAHRYCSAYDSFGRHRHCIAHATYDFAHTVRKLGWMLSLMGIAMPFVFWGIPTAIRYGLWRASGGRPRYSSFS